MLVVRTGGSQGRRGPPGQVGAFYIWARCGTAGRLSVLASWITRRHHCSLTLHIHVSFLSSVSCLCFVSRITHPSFFLSSIYHCPLILYVYRQCFESGVFYAACGSHPGVVVVTMLPLWSLLSHPERLPRVVGQSRFLVTFPMFLSIRSTVRC
ncbi:hypothetical protein BJV78DRAFT_145259 [Lactifluus subvellereus]|nr:hypothetical protein BJV78DRAFT_145259 [Lactifluus subvellereus]